METECKCTRGPHVSHAARGCRCGIVPPPVPCLGLASSGMSHHHCATVGCGGLWLSLWGDHIVRGGRRLGSDLLAAATREHEVLCACE